MCMTLLLSRLSRRIARTSWGSSHRAIVSPPAVLLSCRFAFRLNRTASTDGTARPPPELGCVGIAAPAATRHGPSFTAGAAHAGWGCRTSCMSPALTDPYTPYPLSNHVRPTPSSICALYPLAAKPRRSSGLGPDSARTAPWAHRAVVNAHARGTQNPRPRAAPRR